MRFTKVIVSLLAVTMVTFILSCGVKNLTYNRYKILAKEKNNYKVYVDSAWSQFKYEVYDIDNVNSTIINHKEKRIDIKLHESRKLVSLKSLDFSKFNETLTTWTDYSIGLVLVQGMSLTNDQVTNLKIDPNSIRYIEMRKLSGSVNKRNDYLIISVK